MSKLEVARFMVIAGVALLILGAIFWANGQWSLNVDCYTQKEKNELFGIFTPSEIEQIYAACLDTAKASIRWSAPICLVGAAIFVVFIFPFIVLWTMRPRKENQIVKV